MSVVATSEAVSAVRRNELVDFVSALSTEEIAFLRTQLGGDLLKAIMTDSNSSFGSTMMDCDCVSDCSDCAGGDCSFDCD